MVALRVTTAKRSHSSRPSTTITICMELPMNAATASATRITGSASRVVMMKLTTRSTRPPK
jgi:hypothetical protein